MRLNACAIRAICVCIFLSGCAATRVQDPLAGKRLAPPPADHVAILTHPDRPAGDFAEDATRKPSDVLAFTGIGYGMTVVEIEAGGGYYTELFAHTVGPKGKVFMQNPVAFDSFFGEEIKTRLNDRLGNVQAMRTNFDVLTVADASADLVTWFLGPHELWFRPEGAPADAFGNPEKAFAEIARVMKPGAVFVVMDHSAMTGAPPETGSLTHRIDPAIITRHATRAGLILVETSDLFLSPEDDLTLSVFDPAVRRRTDRFIYKFRKAN